MKWADIPKLTTRGKYAVDMPWKSIEDTLESWGQIQLVETDPDFQRGHVWTQEKQVAYVEYIMRGGYAAREIYWNCTTWGVNRGAQKAYSTPVQLVDGKQRLEAVCRFMRNDLRAFGALYSEFDGIDMLTCSMRWHVNDLPTRADVLRWYIDLNSGGVVHAEEELARVRELLAREVKA